MVITTTLLNCGTVACNALKAESKSDSQKVVEKFPGDRAING